MASSRFGLVAILVIFSLIVTAHSQDTEVIDGPCRLRGTCNSNSDCDVHCHRANDPTFMAGLCQLDKPTVPVCCCLSD
ncbi:unnamed protein product [Cochlearia groenlandica]